jgi:hypothetical protein
MHALVRFAHIAAGNTFTAAEIHPHVLKALGSRPDEYALASLRYDLAKLLAKALVVKVLTLSDINSRPRDIRSAWSS